MSNIIKDAEFVKHPTQEGVFMKHFFSSKDNECLNNLEVMIIPGFEIAPHVHADSSEFFYVVSGEGEFYENGEWNKFKKGYAFKAPKGMEHGIKNVGTDVLVIFSTFSPATR